MKFFFPVSVSRSMCAAATEPATNRRDGSLDSHDEDGTMPHQSRRLPTVSFTEYYLALLGFTTFQPVSYVPRILPSSMGPLTTFILIVCVTRAIFFYFFGFIF